jgi:glycerol-3-phosphate O-acyltransferase
MRQKKRTIFSRIQITDHVLQLISENIQDPASFTVFVLKYDSKLEKQFLRWVVEESIGRNLQFFPSFTTTNRKDGNKAHRQAKDWKSDQPILAILQPQEPFQKTPPFFSPLVDIARESGKKLVLIPIRIIWNKYPLPITKHPLFSGKHRYHSELYNRYMLLVRPKNIAFEIGTPFAPELSDTEAGKGDQQIRSRLFRSLARMERAVVGPPMRSRAHISQRVLKDRRFIRQVEALADGDEEIQAKLFRKAEKILYEMAADFKKSTVMKFRGTLDWAWPKIIEGFWIDRKGMEQYRVLSRKAPALLLPCHRSHADYLIVSYLFNLNNLMLPFIAAGINLSFWPMGPIFRRSGAYFIRRTFKGDKLYPFVLEAYVRRILKDKIPQEFFPEGTRSRTGKLLHPKTGLMAINLTSVRNGDVKDLLFVPLSIIYGKLFETGSYLNEAEGAVKKKENARSVLKTTRLLGKNFGKVYMNFGKMFLLSDYLSEKNIQLDQLNDKEFRDFTTQMGYRVVREIQKSTLITPIALVSILFLSNVRRGMTRDGLMLRLDYALRFFKSRTVPVAELSTAIEEATIKVLNYLVQSEKIEEHSIDNQIIYRPVESRRSYMEYYKNNIIHHFIDVSFVAASILKIRQSSFTFNDLKEEYSFLHKLFYMEFVYETDEPQSSNIHRELSLLEELELVSREGEKYRIDSKSAFVLRNIAGCILSYLEAYYTVLESYYSISRQNETLPPNILPSILTRGKLLHTMGEITREESINKFYYQTGHQWMNRCGLVNWGTLASELRKGERTEQTLSYSKLKETLSAFISPITG